MSNSDLILKLKRPIEFGGQTITEIDLSGLEDLSGSDLDRAEEIYKMDKNNKHAAMELSKPFNMAVAHLATDYPLDFFSSSNFGASDWQRLYTLVLGFLNGSD